MNQAPQQVRSGFLTRYYRWAIAQWEQELDQDFPTLHAFGGFSSAAIVALEVLGALTPTDKATMTRALVRRSHKEAVSLDGDKLSATEEALLDRWLDMSRQVSLSRMFHLEAYKIDRRKLRVALKQSIGSLLGKATHPSSGVGLGYEKITGPWSLNTDFDLGGRNHQLTYFHAVLWEGQLAKSMIGPLEWLGISLTSLNRIKPGEEEKAAESVVGLVRQFLSAEAILMPS
jgi:hypothetical protein